jgi:hypothetical protein
MRLLCLLFISILFLSFSNNLSAQAFKGGIITGLNASNFTGGASNYGLRQIGLAAGGFVQFDLGSHYAFRTEMIFNQKGARKPPNLERQDYFLYNARLNYVDVPLIFTFSQEQFVYEFGPSIGYLIGSKEELVNAYIQERPFRPMDFALNIGLNYHLSDKFDMNWRLSHSFIPIRTHLGASTFRLNRGEYNMVLSIRLIYWIKNKDRNG